MNPQLSKYFQAKQPSAIRVALQLLKQRKDQVDGIDAAIGNVALPMHPALQKRMFDLKSKNSPFDKGVVKYSSTQGFEETQEAFKNIINSSISNSSFKKDDLYVQITDGGSQAMEYIVLGVSDSIIDKGRPILMLSPMYANYSAMAQRTGRKIVTIDRQLKDSGKFALPDLKKLEKLIQKEKVCALIIIPFDNPTGQLMDRKELVELAKLCVKYNLWLVSDEAYRELYYQKKDLPSIWDLEEKEVKGIKGRRISIETTSKVWSACGLRIGAIVSDNPEYITQSVAEATANLCPNVIGQYVAGALAHETKSEMKKWYKKQRDYYSKIITKTVKEIKESIPDIIVSNPDSAIYSVVDFRNIDPDIDTAEFVRFCASKGRVKVEGSEYTLLAAPMAGFYNAQKTKNPGRTQIRISYAEKPERIELIPILLAKLLEKYNSSVITRSRY